jgi:hypothetical protein
MRSTTWGRKLGAAGLALALALVSVATCYAGTRQMSAPSAKARCHGMAADSNSDAPHVSLAPPAHDCCAVPVASLTVTVSLDTALAPSTKCVSLEVPPVALPADSRARRIERDQFSPPTYLLISTFRI